MKESSIIEKPFGKLQIYIQPTEKVRAAGILDRFRSRQLYRELVKFAKADQLLNASVYQTHHGYSMHGQISSTNAELDTTKLWLCVELIDEREKLEAFCVKHAELLRGKMIIFKPVEFWEIK